MHSMYLANLQCLGAITKGVETALESTNNYKPQGNSATVQTCFCALAFLRDTKRGFFHSQQCFSGCTVKGRVKYWLEHENNKTFFNTRHFFLIFG